MKAVYKFSVEGQIKLDKNMPIKARGYVFNFITNTSGIITNINVEIPIHPKFCPKITKDSVTGKTQINITNPAFHFVIQDLRGLESLLSIWGIERIDYRNYSIEWKAESEEEKSLIKIHDYQIRSLPLDAEKVRLLPFDIVAKSVIGAWEGNAISTITSFFRKGIIDLKNEQYIDAIYDFYLIFESLFGEGKSKEDALKDKYFKSDELRAAFDKTVNSDVFMLGWKSELKEQFYNSDIYRGKNFENIFGHFIRLRGHLHHHSLKNKKAWHPENSKPFELDALMMQEIANSVVVEYVANIVNDEKILNQYNAMISELNLET